MKSSKTPTVLVPIDFSPAGTNGTGGLKKIFGTHTGNLITHSNTPVIAVPASYRRSAIRRILYASDLADYTPEIRQLIGFAGPLKANVRLLHLNYLGEIWLNEDAMRAVLKKQFGYPVEVSIIHADPNLSVNRNLQRQMSAFKPSMAVLFSSHRDSAIQRILYPSIAEKVSFQLKAPLLVFPKMGRPPGKNGSYRPKTLNEINEHNHGRILKFLLS